MKILPDKLGYSRKTENLNDKPYCVGCEGDIGECRWSWPLSDSEKTYSDLATWRCIPKYTFGTHECSGNNGKCEDWCTRRPEGPNACRWSWPTADPDGNKSSDAACRCDLSLQEFTYKSEAPTNYGQCDGCTGDKPVCRFSFPAEDPLKGSSPHAIQRCTVNEEL